jgi:hypothetical protein
MNIRNLFCIFSSLLLTSIAQGNGNNQTIISASKHPHHFYFGPEFFWYQLNIDIDDVNVYGTPFFWGMRVGYEYLQPQAFYAGIDLAGASTNTDFKACKNECDLTWHHADREFGNFEVRLGFTFAPKNWLASFFLGAGIYSLFPLDSHNHQGFKESLPYIETGIRSKCALTPIFDIGINAKILRTFATYIRFKYKCEKATTDHNMWGGEIGMPFIWHISATKRWDIQLEPYFLKLDFSETQNIYGTRLIFSYYF